MKQPGSSSTSPSSTWNPRMALQLTQETLDRKDDLSVSHKFCCSSSHSPLVVCRLLASGLHPRNSSGNHFCYFHLFQDCGRESRHVPVVSVGMLLFPLTIAADCYVYFTDKRGEGLLWAEGSLRVFRGSAPWPSPRGRQRRSPGTVDTIHWRCAAFASYPPPGILHWDDSSSLLNMLMGQ